MPRGLDGWNTSADDLADVLAGARELVITDPLSFPWRNLTTDHRAIPVTVTLPPGLDADEVLVVLELPVLRHITRFDRLVDARVEVRTRLTEALDLPDAVWNGQTDEVDGVPRDVAKARLYEAAAATRKALWPLVRDRDAPPLLGFLGDARDLGGPVASALSVPRHAAYPTEPATDDPPAPHALVLWLPDGGQPAAERAELLGRARDLLHPGGLLVVLGCVVTAPGAPPNPSISRLTEELDAAFGGMIQVREVQSVHWRGESMSRGVVIGAVSLRGGVL